MAKPATRPKSRYGLFSVGRNKASPARTASTRRASVRRSVIRGEATQLDFECAGDVDGSRSKLESTPEYVDRE